jgi:hypothetical protein
VRELPARRAERRRGQAYLFDTQGYIKIDGALSLEEVGRLNASFDRYEPTMRPSPNYSEGRPAASHLLTSTSGRPAISRQAALFHSV